MQKKKVNNMGYFENSKNGNIGIFEILNLKLLFDDVTI